MTRPEIRESLRASPLPPAASWREDRSLFARWFWSLDRPLVGAMVALFPCAFLLNSAVTPLAARRHGQDGSALFHHQTLSLILAFFVLFAVAFIPVRRLGQLALLGLLPVLALMIACLELGPSFNGAQRWLIVGSISLQPSEIFKPFFALALAWLFTQNRRRTQATIAAWLLWGISVGTLWAQPDFGQSLIITAIFLLALLASGRSVIVPGCVGLAFVSTALVTLPHVRARVLAFFAGGFDDKYQVNSALSALAHGGVLGQGPGEGRLAAALPEVEADFILALVGEEFGVFGTLTLVALYAFIVLRVFLRCQTPTFVHVAAIGLTTAFALQTLFHMASVLDLMPVKGTALPLLSHGGSSRLAIGFVFGALIALTRQQEA